MLIKLDQKWNQIENQGVRSLLCLSRTKFYSQHHMVSRNPTGSNPREELEVKHCFVRLNPLPSKSIGSLEKSEIIPSNTTETEAVLTLFCLSVLYAFIYVIYL